MNKGENFAIFTLAVLAVVVFGIIFTWPIMWIWNHILVGAVDGINVISFWEAFGLFILARLLFSNSSSVKLNKD